MAHDCTLCGLPVPDEGHSAGDVAGHYCCRGCLEVARAIGSVDGIDRSELRDRVDSGAAATPSASPPTAGSTPTAASAEAYLRIDGMYCTSCEAFLELRAESVDGIASVDASYATDTIRVRYDPEAIDAGRLPDIFSGYGYTAMHPDEDPGAGAHADRETTQRLLVGIVLGMFIMPWYLFFLYPRYVGIETGILSADMTTPAGRYVPMAMIGLFTALLIGYTGWPILRGAAISVRTRRPNMDLLLAVAICGAFGYSTVALVAGSIHLYYDVAVAIVLVVTAGTYYEGKIKRRAAGLLSTLTAMSVSEARRRRSGDGSLETVSVDDIGPNDEIVVRPGERIPIDGTVIEGTAAVDEALLTGESIPATKEPGDAVVGGSIVTDDALVVRAGDAAENTLDRLTSLVWSVQSDTQGIQRTADRLASVFVPLVLLLGVGVTAWYLATAVPPSTAVLAGLTVLVAACPCAMGLATPLAVSAGLRDALEREIVVTTSSFFEAASDIETVIFDKTGTLTTGRLTVTDVTGDPDGVSAAAAVERRSSHPIADAIVDHAADPSCRQDRAVADGGTAVPVPPSEAVSGFERHPGNGVSAAVDGAPVIVGAPEFVADRAGALPDALHRAVQDARDAGQRAVAVARGGEITTIIAIGDDEREEWRDVLAAFPDERVIVLSGDESARTAAFEDHPAVDRVFAGVPPDGKVATVEEIQADGPAAMVGDGTNDAPALGAATLGIAIAGTARAAEAADVVLLDDDLTHVPRVFDLAAGTRRRIRENIGWALCYNGVAIPLAIAGVLNPLFAALAMAGSSILVVTNSKRSVI